MKERIYCGIARNRRWKSHTDGMAHDNDEEPAYQICLEYSSQVIVVALGPTGHHALEEKTAAAMLEFSPKIECYVEGRYVALARPPGWFERKCAEAGCPWFVHFVRRMAASEDVPLEEVRAAYREHNEGKEMPCGTWGSLFRE